MNLVVISGRMAKDPEIKYTNSGKWETNDGQKRRTDECLIHRFEFVGSKPQTSDNQEVNDILKDFGTDEVPFR